MENKKRTLIIIVLIIIILGAVGFFLNDKILENRETKPESNNISIDEKEFVSDIIAIGTRDNSETDKKLVVAITNGGNEIELLDVSEYNGGVIYTYNAGKLYLYLYKYTPGKFDVNTGKTIQEVADYNTLGYIDLSSDNYSLTKLADINADGFPTSIAVVNNNIYFSSSAFDGVYKYNIDTKSSSVSNDFDFNGKKRINLYTISNDKLAYSTSGTTSESPTVGIIDINSNTRKEISSNANFEYIYNGNIVYTQYDAINNYSKWKYYEYNVSSEDKKQISDSTSSVQSIHNSFIIPVDNYYIYVNGNSLYKYEENQSQKIYEFDGGIDSINLISNKTLNISYGMGIDNAAKYGFFDLNELKFNNTQAKNIYTNIIYVD